MRLYIVTSEKGKRYVFAANAVNARRYAIDSGISGHTIERKIWRNADGEIFETEVTPGVRSESEVVEILNKAGYNLDGSKYQKPAKTREKVAQATTEGRKVCSKCGEEKDLDSFTRKGEGGYQSYCKDCKKVINAENYLKRKAKKEI